MVKRVNDDNSFTQPFPPPSDMSKSEAAISSLPSLVNDSPTASSGHDTINSNFGNPRLSGEAVAAMASKLLFSFRRAAWFSVAGWCSLPLASTAMEDDAGESRPQNAKNRMTSPTRTGLRENTIDAPLFYRACGVKIGVN
nr:hypothetical protein Iba_chr09fCG11250 [Ipomoea batatas]